jgi:Ca2+-binding RTX toxin-like protein
MRGNATHNSLFGRGGADTIIGLAGADALYGERGFDALKAADSRRDQLRCGPNEGALSGGTAEVDAIDDVVNCDETLITNPGPLPGPGPGPGPGPNGACSHLVGGTSANDDLRGTAGSDMMRGRGGDDRLHGDRGGDCMRGGKGDDEVRAGPGNDRVRARDGTPEFIRCGAGKKDRAIVGPNDTTRGCERLKQRHSH